MKIDYTYQKKLSAPLKILDNAGGIMLVLAPIMLVCGLGMMLLGSINGFILIVIGVVYAAAVVAIHQHIKLQLLNRELAEHLEQIRKLEKPKYEWPEVRE
jgi:hypothetical protein